MKTVLFGGTFDLLHWGHVLAIKQAKSYGDWLVVNVVNDQLVRQKKGMQRPIIPGEERAALLGQLRDVDEVMYLHEVNNYEEMMKQLLKEVAPSILIINQGEVRPVDRKLCLQRNVVIVEMERQFSQSRFDSSGIVATIRKRYG